VPQYGLKTREQISAPPAVDLSTFPSLPWTMPDAELVQVTFEVDLAAALELLPEQLSRPVPPYARIMIARYPLSPIGPYAEALLLLACRFRMEPKSYVAASVVTSEEARRAHTEIWGLPSVIGWVDLRRERNPGTGTEDITATVAAAGPLTTVRLPDAYAVEPAMVRLDPVVSVRATAGGEPAVIQFSAPPMMHEARLAKGATVTCHGTDWEDPWFRLRSLNMISATFAVADLGLTEPVVQHLRPPDGMMGGGLP
jgi:acetoacetate decarboxylase